MSYDSAICYLSSFLFYLFFWGRQLCDHTAARNNQDSLEKEIFNLNETFLGA